MQHLAVSDNLAILTVWNIRHSCMH